MATSPAGRIKIVHCIGSMRQGGAEKQLCELICRLPRERFEQSLVLIEGGGPLLPRIEAAGVPILELGWKMKYRKSDPRAYFAMSRALARMIAFLRRARPHILHAQLYWANVLSAAAGSLARVPAIVTSRLQLSDYKAGKPILQRIENLANRGTTAIFANSEAVRRDALAHEKVASEKIRVIHNGVVLEDFERIDRAAGRREFGFEPEDIVVIALANLHPYKGHEELIEALARVRARHPELKAILPGRDAGMKAKLEAAIARHGLGGTVKLLGERSDAPKLLQIADIFVHASHQEGFSNSILEAMTAGLPAVVTNVGGNPEAIEDGREGFIVPPRDATALAGAIEKLVDDAELRTAMGRAGREKIEARFSIEVMIRNFAAWYEELAGAAR